MRSVRQRRSAAVVLTVVALLGLGYLTACTGVPSNSTPEVVRTLPGDGESSEPNVRPPTPGQDPQDLVQGFLDANVSSDAEHTVAKQYLTSRAAAQWQPNPVVVVDDYRVEWFADSGVVRVSAARQLGTVDSNGMFRPDASANTGSVSFTFRVETVNRQYRIAAAPDGLILTESQFTDSYRQVSQLYFLDPSLSYLLPDQRYTSLDGQSLSTWILDALINGPSATLVQAARTAFPPGLDPRSARATLDSNGTVTINIPGISRLASRQLRALAAELAWTYDAAGQTSLRLIDGAKTVTVPGLPVTFRAADLAPFNPNQYGYHSSGAFFLRAGAVYSSQDKRGVRISTRFVGGARALRSLAIHEQANGQYDIAGVAQASGSLLIGRYNADIQTVRLPKGTATRPEWDRTGSRLWIAVGSTIYVASGSALVAVDLADPVDSLPPRFEVRAIRLSPEGSRIAVVISTPAGESSLWVGGVSATPTGVEVAGLTQITGLRSEILDAGWSGPTQLYYVGSQAGAVTSVGTIQADGSLNRPVQTSAAGELSDTPTAIAVAPGSEPVVSIGAGSNTYLLQFGVSGWTPLGGGRSQTPGYAPAFAT